MRTVKVLQLIPTAGWAARFKDGDGEFHEPLIGRAVVHYKEEAGDAGQYRIVGVWVGPEIPEGNLALQEDGCVGYVPIGEIPTMKEVLK